MFKEGKQIDIPDEVMQQIDLEWNHAVLTGEFPTDDQIPVEG